MKMEENEKKKKKIVKKAKRIRGIVMMTLLCVLMMSAATYAWFTLSKTAKLANLTMTVGEATGLQIAENTGNGAGQFGSSIEIGKINGKLLPATSADGVIFNKPIYSDDGEVTGKEATNNFLDANNEDSNKEGYYIEYKFWLKSLGQASEVKLVVGDGITDGKYEENETYSGTYILSKTVESTKSVPGSAAVRISFANAGNVAVFEPNCDFNNENLDLKEKQDYAKDTSSSTAVASTIKHGLDGSIVKDGTVIHLGKDEEKLITMYIWIEGTDEQCVNQIAAKDIVGQLVFTNEEPQTP